MVVGVGGYGDNSAYEQTAPGTRVIEPFSGIPYEAAGPVLSNPINDSRQLIEGVGAKKLKPKIAPGLPAVASQIGSIRNIGNPFDPRRGTSVPGQRVIPGSPPVVAYIDGSGNDITASNQQVTSSPYRPLLSSRGTGKYKMQEMTSEEVAAFDKGRAENPPTTAPALDPKSINTYPEVEIDPERAQEFSSEGKRMRAGPDPVSLESLRVPEPSQRPRPLGADTYKISTEVSRPADDLDVDVQFQRLRRELGPRDFSMPEVSRESAVRSVIEPRTARAARAFDGTVDSIYRDSAPYYQEGVGPAAPPPAPPAAETAATTDAQSAFQQLAAAAGKEIPTPVQQQTRAGLAQELNTYNIQQQAEKISQEIGHQVSPQTTQEIMSLVNVGNGIDVKTAAFIVESANQAPEGSRRRTGRTSPELAAALSQLNQDSAIEPIATGMAKAGIRSSSRNVDGQYEPSANPDNYESRQTEANSQYETFATAARTLDARESRAEGNAGGKGKRIKGKANAYLKEGNGPQTPYSVPVIVGAPGQRRGTVTTEQITTGFTNRKPTTVMDTSNSRVVLLNPAALLPEEYAAASGYTKIVPADQTVTGSYSSTPDVPIRDVVDTQDPNRDNNGFWPSEDPFHKSTRRYSESRPMTLAEAMTQLMQDESTPISTFADDQIIMNGDDSFVRNADGTQGQQVFIQDNQRQSDLDGGAAAYRVGYDKKYSRDFYGKAQQLIQEATGGKTVLDPIQDAADALDFELADKATREASIKSRTRQVGGVRPVVGEIAAKNDPVVQAQQAQLLLDSFDAETLGGAYDQFTAIPGAPDPRFQRSPRVPTSNPTVTGDPSSFMAVVNMIARGRGLPAQRDARLIEERPTSQRTNYVQGPSEAPAQGPIRSAAPSRGSISAGQAAEFAPDSLNQLQAELEALGLERREEAKANKVKTQYWKPELARAAKQNKKVAATDATNKRIALEARNAQREAMIAEAAQSPTVIAQNQIAEQKQADSMARASAVSEQNSLPPQSTSTGVMNTDDVSMLNAPEAPMPKDEPTPRQQQIAASAPAQATDAGVSRGRERLDAMLALARRNPYRTAAAAGAGALGTLGAIPWNPGEDQ